MSILNDIFEIVGETGKALGEVVVGVAQDVKIAVQDIQGMRSGKVEHDVQAEPPVKQLTFFEDTHPEQEVEPDLDVEI